jgi:hypothetical protein
MSKIDLIFERIRKLPPDRQEELAAEIDVLLDEDAHESLLTDEQWAEVEAALADDSEPTLTHQEVFARLEAREAE